MSLAAAVDLAQQIISTTVCSADSIVLPEFLNLQVTAVQANLVENYSQQIPEGLYVGHSALSVSSTTFCNVSLAYTNTGRNTPVNVEIWLPESENWNGRMMGAGGGGWAAGMFFLSYAAMAGAVSEGFAAFSTDAGHKPEVADIGEWALNQYGEIDMYLVENLGYRALRDSSVVSKEVTKAFYGTKPTRSYWSGCSQGGRQGLELAQRYPDLFDGVLSFAPAIEIPSFLLWMYWPSQLMNELNAYPHMCEFQALRAAAIEACDLDDGVADGIISDPEHCTFNPTEHIGNQAPCEALGHAVTISSAAANITKVTWHGLTTKRGSLLWPGTNPDAELINLINTECDSAQHCKNTPISIASQYIANLLKEDTHFDLTRLTREDLVRLFSQSVARYDSILGTNNPDLSLFRAHGGKILMLHGLADQLIPPYGSRRYVESVARFDTDPTSSPHDYLRYFEVPGLAHCVGGAGPYPTGAWQALIDWVERGKAPEQLLATWPDGGARPLCMYPLVPRYDGTGDWKDARNYYCAESHLSTKSVGVVLRQALAGWREYFGLS